MERAHADRRPSGARLAILVLVVAVVVLVLAPAAAAGPRSIIFDWVATPSWTATLTGGGALPEEGTDVIALPYAAGATRTGTISSGLILQYNPRGRLTVFAVDIGPAPMSRSYADIAVASDKTVVAVGRSDATGTNQDAYVATWKPDGGAVGGIALPGAGQTSSTTWRWTPSAASTRSAPTAPRPTTGRS